MATASFDHFSQAGPAQKSQGRPDDDTSRSARHLRCEPERMTIGALCQIAGVCRHGGLKQARLAHKCDPAIVGNIEPLVSVRGPRVCKLYAIHQMSTLGGGCRPEPERSIDVNPGVGIACGVADRPCGIGSAGVDVAGLDADECRAGEWRKFLGYHASLVIRRNADDTIPTQTE